MAKMKLSTKWTFKNIFKAADRTSKRVMKRFGSFVRRTAKTSIRKGKKTSAAGSPPKGKTGLLYDRLIFEYEDKTRNVVIGPAKSNKIFFNGNGKPIKGTVPELLEEGGAYFVKEYQVIPGRGEAWFRLDLRSKRKAAGKPTRMRKVEIAKRPYMGPALRENLPKLPAMWQDALKK